MSRLGIVVTMEAAQVLISMSSISPKESPTFKVASWRFNPVGVLGSAHHRHLTLDDEVDSRVLLTLVEYGHPCIEGVLSEKALDQV